MIDTAYALAGALTGFVVGLTGVGGGALMTPILLIFLVYRPRQPLPQTFGLLRLPSWWGPEFITQTGTSIGRWPNACGWAACPWLC